jgi:hypothetical protein
MDQRGIIIKLSDGFEITVAIPYTLASRVSDGCEERLLRSFDALETRVIEDGFVFRLASDTGGPAKLLTCRPEHFNTFLAEEGMINSDLLNLDSDGAASILLAFCKWGYKKQAEEFERDIMAGELTFEEVRTISPEAFNSPNLQKLLASRFKTDTMPKSRRGKRFKYRQAVHELYALACRVYRETPGLSFENACGDACDARPELVPGAWINDPGGNLKREAFRHWDVSTHSQKSYREFRDR